MLLTIENLEFFDIDPPLLSSEMLPELKPVPVHSSRYHKMMEGQFVRLNRNFIGRVFRNPAAARRYISAEKVCIYTDGSWTFNIEPRWVVMQDAYFKLGTVLHRIGDSLSNGEYEFLKTYVGMGKIMQCDFTTFEEQDRILTVIKNEFRYRAQSRFAKL